MEHLGMPTDNILEELFVIDQIIYRLVSNSSTNIELLDSKRAMDQ